MRYAQRLHTSGVRVRLDNYVTMPHDFLNLRLAPTERRRALADVVRELGAAFAAR